MTGPGAMMGDPSGSKKGKQFQHPTYAHLIHDAISTLRQRGGSSAVAIRKSIEQKMGPVLGPNYKKIVGSTLSKLAKTGKLIKTGNTFKLTPEFKQQNLRRRRRHKKKKHVRHRRRRRRRSRRHGRRRRRKGGRRKTRKSRGGRKKRRRRRRSRGRRRHRRRSHSPKRHERSRGKHQATGEKKVRHASHVHIHQDKRSETNSPGDRSP